jgi:MOSC domain-containing protein YiiM
MRILSLNVGGPREVEHQGRTILTSIYKFPVAGRVRVDRLNIEGDQQSDLTVHGGFDKAVYAYPAEHYPLWREADPDLDLPWGAFGENLTTEGLSEETVHIGDRLRAGTAELVVTQPRMPCFKLAIRLDRPAIGKPFLQSRRTGFYLRVLREGEIAAGDPIEVIGRDEHGVSVAEIVSLYTTERHNQELLRRAVRLPALPEDWRDYFGQNLR